MSQGHGYTGRQEPGTAFITSIAIGECDLRACAVMGAKVQNVRAVKSGKRQDYCGTLSVHVDTLRIRS